MFITFEGTEGSGKSTCQRLVAEALRLHGESVVCTREPGGTPVGERVRALILDAASLPKPMATLLLFEAARAQLAAEVLYPALERGAIVLCDRYIDSTLAYQGYGEGISLDTIRALNETATGGLSPHLTFLLDIDPIVGLARRDAMRDWNIMDARELSFHQRVRNGFLSLADAEPGRWRTIDGMQTPAEICDRIVAQIQVWQNERQSAN